MLLSETLRKDGQDGQAAESRLALWLCLAGEVGSALEQESTIAFAVPVGAVTITVWACSVALGSSALGPSSHQP